MESIKRKWGKPGLDVQVFVPQEFISACPPSDTWVTYEFWCDAGGGSSYNVYLDTNGDGQLSDYEERNQYIGNFHACRESHSVTVKKGTSIDDIFPLGIIGPYEWVGSWPAHREYVTKPVRIWRGEKGDNIHCTFTLNTSEFTEKNPS